MTEDFSSLFDPPRIVPNKEVRRGQIRRTGEKNGKTHNKSLHWIFTPLRSVKTSEFNRSLSLRDIKALLKPLEI